MIRIEFCETDALCYLVLRRPGTGVEYTAQTAGVCCNHPSVEGAVVAASALNGLAEKMCTLDSARHDDWTEGWGDAEYDQADRTLAGIAWDAFSQIKDIRMDRARREETEEGWWPVLFTLVDPLNQSADVKCEGVVMGPNCD